MFFTKQNEVQSIDNFEFDSKNYFKQSIELPDKKSRVGYEIKLGYYRQFRTEDALMVITFKDLKEEELKKYDIIPEVKMEIDRLF